MRQLLGSEYSLPAENAWSTIVRPSLPGRKQKGRW
jgi:hypothetical protein